MPRPYYVSTADVFGIVENWKNGSEEERAAAENIIELLNDARIIPTASSTQGLPPVHKKSVSMSVVDYFDGHCALESNTTVAWHCPVCDWFVGTMRIQPSGIKKVPANYCGSCGQKIDWSGITFPDDYATDPEEVSEIKRQIKKYNDNCIVHARERREAERKAPKKWFVCENCGMSIKGKFPPQCCPQCEDGYESPLRYRPATQKEAEYYEKKHEREVNQKIGIIEYYYGNSVAEQIRTIHKIIDDNKTKDAADILIMGDTFLQHCIDCSYLSGEFEYAESISGASPNYLEWYKNEYSEEYSFWKAGKLVPLNLLKHDHLWEGCVSEEIIRKCDESIENMEKE